MKNYQFDDFIFDTQAHALFRADKRIPIGSVAYKILLYFVTKPNQTIQKEELISHVWEDVIISDATLYKQIQRLRDLLSDNGEQKKIIGTIHGVGFEFLPKVITINAEQKNHTVPIKHNRQNWTKLLVFSFIILALIASFSILKSHKPTFKTHGISLYQAIFTMKNAMTINKKAFISQINIRNELGKLLDKRFNENEKLSWERKFFKYRDRMNEEEIFLFDQIRAYTEGPMLENNQLILDLINYNPKILTEIPLADELRSHLTLWLNKYHKVFSKNKKMALLYVGVEDGVPYPSEVDLQVNQWLESHKPLKYH